MPCPTCWRCHNDGVSYLLDAQCRAVADAFRKCGCRAKCSWDNRRSKIGKGEVVCYGGSPPFFISTRLSTSFRLRKDFFYFTISLRRGYWLDRGSTGLRIALPRPPLEPATKNMIKTPEKKERQYGGHALLAKYGPDYFRKLAKKRQAKVKKAMALYKKMHPEKK